MGLIIKELSVAGNKDKAIVRVLFDTGSSESLLRRDIAEKLSTLIPLASPRIFTLGDGKGKVTAMHGTIVDVTMKNCKIFIPVLVLDNLGEEMILGADAFQRWKIKLDPEKEDIIIDPGVADLKLF